MIKTLYLDDKNGRLNTIPASENFIREISLLEKQLLNCDNKQENNIIKNRATSLLRDWIERVCAEANSHLIPHPDIVLSLWNTYETSCDTILFENDNVRNLLTALLEINHEGVIRNALEKTLSFNLTLSIDEINNYSSTIIHKKNGKVTITDFSLASKIGDALEFLSKYSKN